MQLVAMGIIKQMLQLEFAFLQFENKHSQFDMFVFLYGISSLVPVTITPLCI